MYMFPLNVGGVSVSQLSQLSPGSCINITHKVYFFWVEFYIRCGTLIQDNFPCVAIDSGNSEISSNPFNYF